MLEISVVFMCLGVFPLPDAANCVYASDTRGPYATREACEARVAEIKETWPFVFAHEFGWSGPVMMGPVSCVPSGEPI